MAVSEAQRRANQKWDAENMAYQTVKVRRDLLEAFRETCSAFGVQSPSAAIMLSMASPAWVTKSMQLSA